MSKTVIAWTRPCGQGWRVSTYRTQTGVRLGILSAIAILRQLSEQRATKPSSLQSFPEDEVRLGEVGQCFALTPERIRIEAKAVRKIAALLCRSLAAPISHQSSTRRVKLQSCLPFIASAPW